MGREYSNKRSSRARARSSGPHQFLVVTITFLLGYLTATVFDIETVSQWLNNQVLAHQEHPPVKEKPRPVAALPKPKFEFYTLLTNEKASSVQKNNTTANGTPTSGTASAEVMNPTAQAVAANTAVAATKVDTVKTQQAQAPIVKTNEAQRPASVTPGHGTYSVQVASFKARHDAEHMKGLLTLKGFNVSVVPVNHPIRGTWFRVMVGPYANRTLAQKAQLDLARNAHLRGMVTAG